MGVVRTDANDTNWCQSATINAWASERSEAQKSLLGFDYSAFGEGARTLPLGFFWACPVSGQDTEQGSKRGYRTLGSLFCSQRPCSGSITKISIGPPTVGNRV